MKKKWTQHLGWVLIAAGILLFAVSFVVGWTTINAVQLSAFALILCGVVLYVWKLKKESKY